MDLDFITKFDFSTNILTAIVSTFVGMFVSEVFRPIKNIKGSCKKVKKLYKSIKYRVKVKYFGYPTFEKLVSIQERKWRGDVLTAKEEKLYEKHIRPTEESMKAEAKRINDLLSPYLNKD